MKILPNLNIIADTMSDFFGPDDCREEPVLRKGQIKKCDGTITNGLFIAYCPLEQDKRSEFAFLTKDDNESNYSLSTGCKTKFLEDLLFPIIGTRDW